MFFQDFTLCTRPLDETQQLSCPQLTNFKAESEVDKQHLLIRFGEGYRGETGKAFEIIKYYCAGHQAKQ